jgi:3-phenylpropionate/cinnamic acid dioxygenase small subunit
VDDVQWLFDLEQIRVVKARYCRLLDLKLWQEWRELFTDDLVVDVTGSVPPPNERFDNADSWVGFVSAAMAEAKSVHHVHQSEVNRVDANKATGSWAVFDYVEYDATTGFRGYGYYDETYRRQSDGWRIASMILTRIRIDPLT